MPVRGYPRAGARLSRYVPRGRSASNRESNVFSALGAAETRLRWAPAPGTARAAAGFEPGRAAGLCWELAEPEGPTAAERDLAERAEVRSPSGSERFAGRPGEQLGRRRAAAAGAAEPGAERGRNAGSAGGSFPRAARAASWTSRWFRSGLFWPLSPAGGMRYSGCELVTR